MKMFCKDMSFVIHYHDSGYRKKKTRKESTHFAQRATTAAPAIAEKRTAANAPMLELIFRGAMAALEVVG